MSETNLTLDDVIDSMTGHDEMEISTQFGQTLGALARGDRTMLARAGLFILKRRDGLNDDDARNAALDMTLKAVLEYFAEESEESGKDVAKPEPSPESSPSGAPVLAAVGTSS